MALRAAGIPHESCASEDESEGEENATQHVIPVNQIEKETPK